MDSDALSRALLTVPEPTIAPNPAIEDGIARSIAYLETDAAIASVRRDVYWPKWDSPWWHLVLLDELGASAAIPARIVGEVVAELDAIPLQFFPIRPGESPPGTDYHRDVVCHCALGSIQRVLIHCGVDVARALPWTEPWFARYQMADGGLNCDETAYLVAGACPSSMVATVALFEALLLRAPWTVEQRAVLDRAAAFLIERELVKGSDTEHNRDERNAAPSWCAPTFPRFYFYDVLRGLAALVRYAEATGAELPIAAVAVAGDLAARFPDGVVRVERRAHAASTTILPTADRTPSPRGPASTFAALDAASVVGESSAALTRQWSETRRGLVRLIGAGRVIDRG